MAQFLTLQPVLFLLAVFYPIVCPRSKMFHERRDRAPHLAPSERNPQYLGAAIGSLGSHLRKGHTPPNNSEQETTDSAVDNSIRSVFSTNFGPGLYLFKNIVPFVSQPHFNSYDNHMIGDQPDPYTPPSSSSTNGMELFKVQRDLVYNQDYVPKMGNDREKQNKGLNKDGFPLKNDKISTSLPTMDHNTDDVSYLPVDESDETGQNNEIDISDCLEHDDSKSDKVFCSHNRKYPEKNHLEDLIKKKYPNLDLFFGEDLVLPENISQRINSAPNEEYLCRSRVRVIFPQSGLNKEYNWLYIVNSPNYKQGIRIEECLDPGSTCGENTGLSLPNRFTATCEQTYIYRSLIAYTNKTIVKDTFRVPSCCKCLLRSY